MSRNLGKSIYFHHVFTELAKSRSKDQNFEELLELKSPAFRKIKKEYEHRLNRLYTHPLLGDRLDSGEIDYAILNALEQVYKSSGDGTTVLRFGGAGSIP